MNLRVLAEKDLAMTLENFGEGVEITFTDLKENEYKVFGRVGDIGYSYDTEGNRVAGRTVCAMWRLSKMMKDEKPIIPSRGWECQWKDVLGVAWKGYVVWPDIDRTLGIGRVWLSFDLEKE